MTIPTISDVQLTIELAREIETALVERGATGSGLRDKAMCFEAYLPSGVWKAIGTIGRERNHIAHVHLGTLSDREGYVRACELVLRAIRGIPAHAVATLPPPRPGFGSPYPQRARGRAAPGSLAWQVGSRVVENHVRRKARRAAIGIATFIVGAIGVFIILVVSALTYSRPLHSEEVSAPTPSGDARGASSTDSLFSAKPHTSDRSGARSTDMSGSTRKAPKDAVGSLDRISARTGNANSKVSGLLPGAVPASPQDGLPSLEGIDSSGQRPAIDADLALGRLGVTAAPVDDRHRAVPAANRGTVDLRSKDLEAF